MGKWLEYYRVKVDWCHHGITTLGEPDSNQTLTLTTVQHAQIVYKLNFEKALELEVIAPMSEQIA